MLLKKQKFAKKTHVGYFIGYDLFNIYRIWNINKNKVIKTKDVIFDENLCYDSTDINLNQLINESFIEIDLFKLIQSNFIEVIEIDSNEELEFNLYLLKLKLYNNVESLD